MAWREWSLERCDSSIYKACVSVQSQCGTKRWMRDTESSTLVAWVFSIYLRFTGFEGHPTKYPFGEWSRFEIRTTMCKTFRDRCFLPLLGHRLTYISGCCSRCSCFPLPLAWGPTRHTTFGYWSKYLHLFSLSLSLPI